MESFYCGSIDAKSRTGLTLGVIGIVKGFELVDGLNEQGQVVGKMHKWIITWYGYDLDTLELIPKFFEGVGPVWDANKILPLGELSEIDAEEAIAKIEDLNEDEDIDDLDTEERIASDVNAGPPGLTQSGETTTTPEATI